MTRAWFLILGALIAATVGCDGPRFVPVSGVVQVDGKPYAKAVVSFQPVAVEGNANPGRGSSAYTDENGRFVLKCDGEIDGAVIGKHLVRIMTRGNEVVGQLPEGGSPDGGTARIDPIPTEWNALSNQTFDVPPKGTDQANFNIVTKRS